MLWLSRTPLRVSLFGGGTDYPEYFERSPGAVVGFAISKYIHIAALHLTAYQNYNYRVSYSQLEQVGSISEIQHPVVKAVLQHFKFSERLDLSVMSDLPASGSGLGSSSSFTVGLLKLITEMQGRNASKIDIARTAIMVERDLLGENVGVQDQLHATFGGVNRFDFQGSDIRISPVQMPGAGLEELGRHLVLVHTGIARRATTTVAAQIEATKSRSIDSSLSALYDLVGECVVVLEGGKADMLPRLGEMLSDSWKLKRALSDKVSNLEIDDLYEMIMRSGAYGAKLCGAGGGGFFLALVPPERQEILAAAVAPFAVVPVGIELDGSTLIYPAGMRQRR